MYRPPLVHAATLPLPAGACNDTCPPTTGACLPAHAQSTCPAHMPRTHAQNTPPEHTPRAHAQRTCQTRVAAAACPAPVVLRERVERVGHLDDDDDGERERCRLGLAFGEVLARLVKRDERAARGVVVGRKALPRGAALPVRELVPCHGCVTVRAQVYAHEAVKHVPGAESANLR
eukprot:362507-Chlamydomonas_euryale.AAC.3